MAVVTLLYYALVAFVSAVLVVNLLKSRKWERDVLYVLVLLPFLLRLFRLK
jgi:ABC-type spermidine/putrescine transport system permease subunit I